MSQTCPLCGRTKPEEALFCEDCSRKIHKEYEVDMPEEISREDTPSVGDLSVGQVSDGKINSEDDPIVNDPVDGEDNESIAGQEARVNEAVSGAEQTEMHPETEKTVPKRKKRVGAPVLFILVIALLAGAFFIYNATIRKSNLDRSGWDAAVKANSIEGYLTYMEAHPRGVHFEEAQAGLLALKSEEAVAWERMKETDNVTELRDFLDRHSGSPYVPLVKTRLDSLIWTGTLQTNTPESYADYIMLSENGSIRGDYIAEAQKRYDLLSRSQTADAATLDSIRATVDGFFIALSALDHNGMVRFLAPTVYRFFNSGAATRERIIGELLVTGAQTEGTTLKFTPDLESVQYEATASDHYKVNVPLLKTYPKDGATAEVHGYIAHIEMDPLFQIVSIFETKPYPEAP